MYTCSTLPRLDLITDTTCLFCADNTIIMLTNAQVQQGLLGSLVIKVLDCRPGGPRFQPTRQQGFFHLGVYSALPPKYE